MSFRLLLLVLLAPLLLSGCEVRDETTPRAASETPTAAASRPAGSQSLFPSQRAAPVSQQTHGDLPFVKGFKANYGQAVAASKPILLFFTADWCHYCHQMADEAFTHPQVVGLADRFVCILVDADDEPEVCKQFRVQGYPTVQFLSPRGVPLNRLVGKKPSNQVIVAMQAALQNVAQKADADSAKQR